MSRWPMELAAFLLMLWVPFCPRVASGAPAGEGAVRLAIVPVGPTNSPVWALADLLGLQFTNESAVILVDRTEVDKIRAEQRIGLANSSALFSRETVQAGKVLGADGFLMLEQRPGKTGETASCRFSLLETRYGLKKFDRIMPLDRPAASSAKMIADQVGPALAFLTQTGGVMRVIGVLDFKSRELNPRWNAWGETLRVGLELELGRYPTLVVAERRRVTELMQERELVWDIPESLQSSAVLIEGAFEFATTSNRDMLTVHPCLILKEGRCECKTVAGSTNDMGGMIRALARSVAETLRAGAEMVPLPRLAEINTLDGNGRRDVALALMPMALAEGSDRRQFLYRLARETLAKSMRDQCFCVATYLLVDEADDGLFSETYRRFIATLALQAELKRLAGIVSPTETADHELRLTVDLLSLARFKHLGSTMGDWQPLADLGQLRSLAMQRADAAGKEGRRAAAAAWTALEGQMRPWIQKGLFMKYRAEMEGAKACSAGRDPDIWNPDLNAHWALSTQVLALALAKYTNSPCDGVRLAFGEPGYLLERLLLTQPQIPTNEIERAYLAYLENLAKETNALVRASAHRSEALFYSRQSPAFRSSAKAREHLDRMLQIYHEELEPNMPPAPNEWVSAERGYGDVIYWAMESLLFSDNPAENAKLRKEYRLRESASKLVQKRDFISAAQVYVIEGEFKGAEALLKQHHATNALIWLYKELGHKLGDHEPVASNASFKADLLADRAAIQQIDGKSLGVFTQLVLGEGLIGIVTKDSATAKVGLVRLDSRTLQPQAYQVCEGRDVISTDVQAGEFYALTSDKRIWRFAKNGAVSLVYDGSIEWKELRPVAIAILGDEYFVVVQNGNTGIDTGRLDGGGVRTLSSPHIKANRRSELDGLNISQLVADRKRQCLWVTAKQGITTVLYRYTPRDGTLLKLFRFEGHGSTGQDFALRWEGLCLAAGQDFMDLDTFQTVSYEKFVWPYVNELTLCGRNLLIESAGQLLMVQPGDIRPKSLMALCFPGSTGQVQIAGMALADQGLLLLTKASQLYRVAELKRDHAWVASALGGVMAKAKQETQRQAREYDENLAWATQWWQGDAAKKWLAARGQSSPSNLVFHLANGIDTSFVWIDSLKMWVGQYEVTAQEFGELDRPHISCLLRFDPTSRCPVIFNNWRDHAGCLENQLSARFAKQLPEGYVFRRPTANEWMAFARCGTQRKYPWGDEWPPKYGNYGHVNGYEDGFEGLAPVEQSGRNEWGLYGVGGNAWEGCLDGKGRGASCKEWVQNALRIDHNEFVRSLDACAGLRFVIGRKIPGEIH